MRTWTRVLALTVGIIAMFTAFAGMAQASTWHNTGDTAFTATSSGASFSTGSGTLACTGATMTGTVGTSSAGPTWVGLGSGSVTYAPCRIAGVAYTMVCTYTLDAISWNLGTDIVTMTWRVNCSVRVAGREICRITGTITLSYANPRGAVFGQWTTGTANLIVTNGTDGPCPLGNNVAITVSVHRFTVSAATGGPTPHLGPNIRQP